ncbi:isocitrate lyase/phosphoenolpyruvate mutase family protein [Streptomyces sp. NPDC032161]|uniref:isocitrate lyase/PEP mutase family protein n=1 Tax=unclassified Streptomyces TaxID=2593676 RepID=UPI0033EED26C
MTPSPDPSASPVSSVPSVPPALSVSSALPASSVPSARSVDAFEPFEAFAALHRAAGSPLLIPNAWDHASASALAAQGFPAIGTTSLGVAASAGVPDGTGATRAETLLLARRLGREPYLLSVDVEGGFGDEPGEVAELARELADAGAVGINLEDGLPDGTLAPTGVHTAKIAAVKSAVPELFVNARTDTYWLGVDRAAEETERRLHAYEQAGADGVFVPGLADPVAIATLVKRLEAPLNILYSPSGPTVSQLGDLGVRRVSLGSLLFRTALGAAVRAATDIRVGRSAADIPVGRSVADGGVPTYAWVRALSDRAAPGAPAAVPSAPTVRPAPAPAPPALSAPTVQSGPAAPVAPSAPAVPPASAALSDPSVTDAPGSGADR